MQKVRAEFWSRKARGTRNGGTRRRSTAYQSDKGTEQRLILKKKSTPPPHTFMHAPHHTHREHLGIVVRGNILVRRRGGAVHIRASRRNSGSGSGSGNSGSSDSHSTGRLGSSNHRGHRCGRGCDDSFIGATSLRRLGCGLRDVQGLGVEGWQGGLV